MKCDKAQEFLSDYIESTLDRPMTVALESHLSGCEACSADVAGLRGMFAVLDKVPQVEPPADFVWRTTTRLQNELLNRREAEQAKALPWWKRLTPVQSFSYAAIAALLVVGIAVPSAIKTQTWGVGWPFGAHVVNTLSAPQFQVQVPGENGAAATVTVTATSELPNAMVWMAYETPVEQSLKGRLQPVTPRPRNLDASQSVPLTVQRGGASAVKFVVRSNQAQFEKTLLLPGGQAVSVQNGDPYYALQQVADLTGQPLLVDAGLAGQVSLDLQSVAPQQALQQVLTQVGARATVQNNVLVITK